MSETYQLLGDVCVLGLGRTGLAVASYLAERLGGAVRSVTLYGGATATASDETHALEGRGVRVVLGTERVSGSYDLAIASPGIPVGSAFFRSAAACAREVIGEPEFAWRQDPERWVAITGTNGKTTTTLLTCALLNAGGLYAQAVGNVGTVATGQLDARERGSWFVAELSSFQLETTRLFHPRVACLLNVTPDHLEWHGSMEAYAAAKEKEFANLAPEDLAVVSVSDDWCRDVIERLLGRGRRVCVVSSAEEPATECAAFVRDGRLVVRLDGREQVLVRVEEMALKGEHNVQNALVACACALELGASVEALCEALRGFAPLEHRVEPCGEVGGVRFVNDSKPTNVDSVDKALRSFEPGQVIVLLGGHDKGTELDELVQAVRERCKAAVCYGAAGPRIAQSLRAQAASADLMVREAPHMREALEESLTLAGPGDVVLLSPACSSFDEFGSYKERGVVFKRLVADVVAHGGVLS